MAATENRMIGAKCAAELNVYFFSFFQICPYCCKVSQDALVPSQVSSRVCSPSTHGSGSFLLTVAHYVHLVQSCDVPVTATRLLAALAAAFPMSLLACLGQEDAEAVRDAIVFRLESHTQDARLKVVPINLTLHLLRKGDQMEPLTVMMYLVPVEVEVPNVLRRVDECRNLLLSRDSCCWNCNEGDSVLNVFSTRLRKKEIHRQFIRL
jgi:hypothetical protein